jgi:opacity protein-like surface antigen
MRLSSAALAGIFLVSGLAAAIAQDDGFGYLPYPGEGNSGLYASLRGSMALAGKDGATTVPTAPTPVALRGSHDTGYGGSIVLGGHLPLGFKVELEGLYRRRPYESVNLGGISSAASGFRDVAAPMGNLLWEMPIDGVPIRPFIGGGAGMAYTHSRLNDPTGGNIYMKNSNWHFAWQGMAGFKLDVAPGARLSAMYRYFQVDDVAGRCGIAGQAPALACRASNTDQSVDLGLELDL